MIKYRKSAALPHSFLKYLDTGKKNTNFTIT